MNTQSPLFKTIAHLLIAVMWAQPLHSIAANLSVDHQGGGNTHITSANNGVPVVNIATPNGKGLSHNKFADYNVGQQGLILNNSTDKLTSTQLGGIIFGNSQLGGKAANTILNEVTGGQRSQLKGYTEVAGKQAHVIVANPHGITCDGCGFINTPQATLTTGQPMLEQGQLQGYDVNGGDIEIAGAGLNASNISRFDLITRSAKINAELHANELNIITGRNQVAADTLKATAKTDTTNDQPLLAIDSSALGGMYAGAIRLVGTEAGVGVKLAGDMAASAGDIQIDVNGKLVIARAAAGQNLQLTAESIELEKDAYAGKKAQVTAQTLRVQDSLAAGELIEIEATRFENTGVTEAGIRTDGTAQSAGQMIVRAEQVVNSGELASHGALEMAVHSLDNRQGHISSTAMGSIYADDVNNHQGHIVSQGNLDIAVQELNNGDGVLLAERRLTVQANAVTNAEDGLLAAGTDADILLSGGLNNAGRIQAGQDLSVHGGSGTLVNSGSLGAGAEVQLTAAKIRNDEGVILSGGDLQLTGDEIINRRGDMFSLGGVLITAQEQDGIGGRFSNLSGTVESVGDLQIQAAQIENAREDFATHTYKYSARLVHVGCIDCSGTNEDALFRLDEIDRTEVLRNSPQAQLLSGGDMQLQGEQIGNWYSLIAAAGNLSINAKQLSNQGAQTGDVFQSRVLHSHRVRASRVGGQIADANAFSARNWYGSSSYNPGNISSELNSFISRHIQGTRSSSEPVVSNVEYHHATLQAAGSIHIDAEEHLNNSQVRPSFEYVSGGSTIEGAIGTLIPLNPQQMADLTQQPVGTPEFVLPQGSNGLFNISRNPGHNYLIETNPLLANMRQFLSSDYLLGELGLSPENMQKRLGDGLYEQKLMREAWVARTGQRFIAGLDSDEAMFRYLMDNAIASKEALNLSVGISLSAEQVAALTHDIVWMEEREVMGEKVLVPVLYMAQAEGRLAPSGALIQGQDLALISGGDLSNQGTLRATNNLSAQAQNIQNSGLMQAGERLSLLAEDSLYNRQGGILAGRDVDLTARTGDILNERSITRHESALGNSRWETGFADSAARIEAANGLSLNAGSDVLNLGGVLNSGGDMQITAGRDVSLSSVEERHSISRGSHYLNSQTAQLISDTVAGGNLDIQAGRDLTAVASRIESGQDMQLVAGNDLTLASAANESHHYSKSKKRTSQRDLIQQQGTEVVSGGQFAAVAGNDLTLISSNIAASNEAYLVAGGKVQLLAEQDIDYSFYEKKKKGSFGRKSYRMSENDNSTAVVSSIQAGTDLLIRGTEAIVTQGAQLTAGKQLELQSGGDILLLAAENSSSQASAKSKSGLLSSKGKTSSQSQTQVVGTTVDAGSILIAAGQDLQVSAGDLRAQGDMALQAGRDVELSSATQYSSQSQSKHSSKLGFSHHALLTHTQKQQAAEQGSGTAVGSYLSADNLLINSGRDTDIQGSTLISERDMRVSAGRDLHIGSVENTSYNATSSSSKKTGEIGSWWQPATGQVKQTVKTQGETLQQSGSQLASLAGNIHLQAGETYQQTASNVLALEGDIHIQGKQVNIEAGYDQLSHSETRSANRTAVGGTVSIPIVNAIQNMQQVNKARERTDDPRMQTLAAATLAMQGKAAYDGAQALYNGNVGGIKISLNLSNNNSRSHSTQQGQNVSASSVIAGGDIHVQATGAQDSDLNIIGSRLFAGQDIRLQADRNILLRAAENTATQTSKESGGGWSVGVGFGLGGSQNGFTLELAANQFRGTSDGNDSLWSNIQVEAGREVHLESGADTRLQGAVVTGEQVTAEVGGNLLLESLQDRSTYQSKQSSSSAGVSLCIPPFCAGTSTASASQSSSKARGDYASVNQQTGIQAGDGGFQLKVNGRTDLTGAVIASSKQAVQDGLNRLETGTLVVRDIENHAQAKASSNGLSLSSDMLTSGKYGIAKGVVGNELDRGAAKETSSGHSLSAISEGKILIKDEAGQLELTGQSAEETLTLLRRDTDNTHTAAERIDIGELERDAEAQRIIKQAVFAEAVKFTDETYRVMFLEEAKVYEVVRNEEGKIKFDDDGNAVVRELSPDEKKSLGSDGKRVKIFNNGIFNIKEAAEGYAAQMLPGSDEQVYLIHFPAADNAVSELLVAGYQKFLENDFWGLANATLEAKDMMKLYGETGLDIAGHSRGSMTLLNAMQSLQKEGAVGSLSETMVHFFGPAANAQTAAKLLYELSGGKQDTVYLQNHKDDFVGTILGGNPATYDKVPEGSNKIKEWINMFNEQPTVHSCYGGNAPEKCTGEHAYGKPQTFEVKYKK